MPIVYLAKTSMWSDVKLYSFMGYFQGLMESALTCGFRYHDAKGDTNLTCIASRGQLHRLHLHEQFQILYYSRFRTATSEQ